MSEIKHPVIEAICETAYKPKCSLCGGTQVVNGIEPGISVLCPRSTKQSSPPCDAFIPCADVSTNLRCHHQPGYCHRCGHLPGSHEAPKPMPRTTTWTAALMCSNCATKWTIEVPRGDRIETGGDNLWQATFPPSPNERCPNCDNTRGVRQDWERQKEMASNADSKASV